jgi:hypothetical protein
VDGDTAATDRRARSASRLSHVTSGIRGYVGPNRGGEGKNSCPHRESNSINHDCLNSSYVGCTSHDGLFKTYFYNTYNFHDNG